MNDETVNAAMAIHRRVDEIAHLGADAIGELTELLYYADEQDTLPFLRRFVFMTSAERRALFKLAEQMARVKQIAQTGFPAR